MGHVGNAQVLDLNAALAKAEMQKLLNSWTQPLVCFPVFPGGISSSHPTHRWNNLHHGRNKTSCELSARLR